LINFDFKGKSRLVQRIVENDDEIDHFRGKKYFPKTVGVDFKRKIFEIEKTNTKVLVNFYDTSGNPKYDEITTSYFFNVQLFLMCYDVTDINSFMSCKLWIEKINKSLENNFTFVNDRKLDLNNKKLLMILVGCKNDFVSRIEKKIQVTQNEAIKFAKENDFSLFLETSARDRSSITHLTYCICMELISNYINYLKYSKEIFDLISINSFPSTRFSVLKDSMSLDAITSLTQVHFNCTKEKLNLHNILINFINSKRKNLLTKSFFDIYMEKIGI